MLPTPRLTDARILVVDDERVNVVLLVRILEQDGYRNVKSVTDPSEAVALYDQFEPDLVLLDLHMPQRDGFAVMKLLEDRISRDTCWRPASCTCVCATTRSRRGRRPDVEQHMWRRYGDAFYTLLTLAVFGFETIALGGLSLSFLLGSATGIASTRSRASCSAS